MVGFHALRRSRELVHMVVAVEGDVYFRWSLHWKQNKTLGGKNDCSLDL